MCFLCFDLFLFFMWSVNKLVFIFYFFFIFFYFFIFLFYQLVWLHYGIFMVVVIFLAVLHHVGVCRCVSGMPTTP